MVQELAPAGRLAVAVFTSDGVNIVTPIATGTVDAWIALVGTVPATNITDVDLGTSPIYANTNTRGNTAGGFSSQKPVLREGSVTFEILWRTSFGTPGDTSFEQILIDKADDLTELSVGFFDYDPKTAPDSGDTVQGLVGNWYVAVEKSEAIEDVQRFSVTLTVGSGAIWHKITTP